MVVCRRAGFVGVRLLWTTPLAFRCFCGAVQARGYCCCPLPYFSDLARAFAPLWSRWLSVSLRGLRTWPATRIASRFRGCNIVGSRFCDLWRLGPELRSTASTYTGERNCCLIYRWLKVGYMKHQQKSPALVKRG